MPVTPYTYTVTEGAAAFRTGNAERAAGECTEGNAQQWSVHGALPDSIGALRELASLNVNNNRLSSSIPSTIGRLTRLTGLGLAFNAFEGSVPPHLSQTHAPTSTGELSAGPAALACSPPSLPRSD